MKKTAKPARGTHKTPTPKKQALPESAPQVTLRGSVSPFPIVGIGASAGEPEALELFLANVPRDSGMAFVIVQHLDPTHKGIMAEPLQRVTDMPVAQVQDRTRVRPNCVYIIPPNKDLTILHRVLHLLDPLAPRGLRLPIDFFFRSLAQDQQEQSIGVILSGTGSDGILGLRAIKEKAGVAFVQDPATAKFDEMPRSAVDAGLADVIAPVQALPDKITFFLRHIPLFAKSELEVSDKDTSALDKVILLLRGQTGHDFSLYKKSTIYRRIERRMGLHQITKIADYARFLQENPQETELLFRELLIGVTSFFRDPEAWEQLKTHVVPALLTGLAPQQVVRAWVPACSTGEEAYSLAIVFKEALEEVEPARHNPVQIFATDLDDHAIARARAGLFPSNITADISAERLERYFVQTGSGYQAAKSIREMIIFAPQNILMDPPFTRLDLVSCRNLLIYLTPELQTKLLQLIHYALNPGGFLFLGNAVTVGPLTNLFTPIVDKARLYRRLAAAQSWEPVEFPGSFVPKPETEPIPTKPAANLQQLADQLLLQKYSPAAVLTNSNGDILYISGRTGKYLEPAAGKANWNIFAMAREGLRFRLTGAFHKALRQKETIALENVLLGTDGGKQVVHVSIQSLHEPSGLDGMVLCVFTDVAAPRALKTLAKPHTSSVRVAELEQELDLAHQEVQNTREEMQTSQEELKSINEEMQSTNEELQSTNEELTTSKEELQSMNEELHTVNQELSIKLDELARANNDMKNLLDSTDIATLFLDNHLSVRRLTNETSHVTRLIPADVGRPITDIASPLLYPELPEDARQVLRTLVQMEKQIALADGRWFAIRIQPYRTLDNRIEGVVITFTDITSYKTLEAEQRAVEARLRERLSASAPRSPE